MSTRGQLKFIGIEHFFKSNILIIHTNRYEFVRSYGGMNAWKPSPIQIGFDLEKPYKFKSLFKSVQNASTTIIQNDAHFPPDQMNARLAFCVMGKFYVVKEGCASNHLLYYLSVG